MWLSLAICTVIMASILPVSALSQGDQKAIYGDYPYFSPEDTGSCTIASGSNTNLDYAGNPILNDVQLKQIAANQSVYEQAAEKVDIPWQMIAAIHLIEHGLKVDNPPNAGSPGSDGPYQIVSQNYQVGPISQEEFLQETITAAQFIKSKVDANYPTNRSLTASGSTIEAVKDTFYSYNGRGYASQAASLGFDPDTQAYEGSPYVMNKADAKRDPNVNPTTWGQIIHNGGSIEYPAHDFYGAFVVYAAIAGVQINCGGNGQFSWPEAHSNEVTSCYGQRILDGKPDFHYGLDIAGGSGTPILAAANGVVSFAGPVGGYGDNYVVIKHSNGFSTGYGHMSSKSVKVGDNVSQGQQIGTEGSEGHSTGFHLHFNVIPGDYSGSDKPNVDPLQNGLKIPDGVANPNGCS